MFITCWLRMQCIWHFPLLKWCTAKNWGIFRIVREKSKALGQKCYISLARILNMTKEKKPNKPPPPPPKIHTKPIWFMLIDRMLKIIVWESLNRLFILICKEEFWSFLKIPFWSTWPACLYYLFCGITCAYSSMVKLHYKRNIILIREFNKWGSVPSSAKPGFFTAHSQSMLSLSDSHSSTWRYAKPFSLQNACIINRKTLYYDVQLNL